MCQVRKSEMDNAGICLMFVLGNNRIKWINEVKNEEVLVRLSEMQSLLRRIFFYWNNT